MADNWETLMVVEMAAGSAALSVFLTVYEMAARMVGDLAEP